MEILIFIFIFILFIFCYYSYFLGIFRCYETFDEGNEIYIVTELVAGGELFDRIVAKTQYTEKEARDLVRTLLETMAYMHDVGIVHRDLKPENLLLCSGKECTNYVTFIFVSFFILSPSMRNILFFTTFFITFFHYFVTNFNHMILYLHFASYFRNG